MGEILTPAELVRRTHDDRAAGRTIAMASGTFDLLHVGHVRCLESAAREADVLVVAVDDDASVRGLAGEGRPIMKEDDRAEIVAALRCVDYVVIVRAPVLDPLLAALQPDRRRTGDPTDRSTRDLLARIARD